MALLRIADFLDLGEDRAPVIGFSYKELKSPVSADEWRKNQQLRKVSWGNPEPESIDIPARPADVYSYLGLKDWLTAIQRELDTTWAVLGEVYAAHARLSVLGLAIRRVHSNILDDAATFARSSPFVPQRIELGVAGPDILKLFIEPLYGKHPEIGIRELIQNAVDAVRERREFERRHPQQHPELAANRAADVIVWLDDPDESGHALLTVSDNGIGMTEQTIANYFLKVGASFRRSIVWRKEFETEATVHGTPRIRSRVLRSGRFGIGVLASFLLTDEVEVSTRHIASDRGIRFSMRLDLRPPHVEIMPIQLNYDPTLEVGTTIKLRVTKAQCAEVKKHGQDTIILGQDIFRSPGLWDWYCLTAPSVMRVQGQDKKILEQSSTVPDEENRALPYGWYRLESADYRTVHVNVNTSSWRPPHLTCNGIRIEGVARYGPYLALEPAHINWYLNFFPPQGVFGLQTPDFSIFDPDGNLPLNLQRTGLTTTDLEFREAAFEAQAKAFLARFLVLAPQDRVLTEEFRRFLSDFLTFDQVLPVFFTSSGSAALTRSNLSAAEAKTCLLLNVEAFREEWLAHIQQSYDGVMLARWGQHASSPIYALNQLGAWVSTVRIITRKNEEPVVRKPFRFRYKELSLDGFHVYRTANCPASLFCRADIELLRDRFLKSQGQKELQSHKDFIAAELFLKPLGALEGSNNFSIAALWRKMLQEPVAPYDLNERHRKLAHAYSDLREYMPEGAPQPIL